MKNGFGSGWGREERQAITWKLQLYKIEIFPMEVAAGMNEAGEEIAPPSTEDDEVVADSPGPASIMTGESVAIDLEGGGDEGDFVCVCV